VAFYAMRFTHGLERPSSPANIQLSKIMYHIRIKGASRGLPVCGFFIYNNGALCIGNTGCRPNGGAICGSLTIVRTAAAANGIALTGCPYGLDIPAPLKSRQAEYFKILAAG